jgi:hypothetical protein
VAVSAVLHWATAPGRTKRRASLVICSPQVEAVPHAFLPFDTGPTWAYPAHFRRRWHLRPSQCCTFCPALRLGDHDPRGPSGRPFHVLLRNSFGKYLLLSWLHHRANARIGSVTVFLRQLASSQEVWAAFTTGGFRSALLHRQCDEFAQGHVREPGLDCVLFWLQP